MSAPGADHEGVQTKDVDRYVSLDTSAIVSVPTRMAPVAVRSSGEEATAKTVFVSPATLHARLGQKEAQLDVEIVELSPRGVTIVAVEALTIEMPVRLQFDLPGPDEGAPVEIDARVLTRLPLCAEDMVLGRTCFRYVLRFPGADRRMEEDLLRAVFYIQARARARARSRLS